MEFTQNLLFSNKTLPMRYWLEILPGIDKVFDFNLSSVKYSYIIKKPIAKLSGDLVIEEEIIAPSGSIMKNDNNGKQTKNGWEGDLSIFGNDNTEIGKIYRAVLLWCEWRWLCCSIQIRKRWWC